MKSKTIQRIKRMGSIGTLVVGGLLSSGCDIPKNFDYAANQDVPGGYRGSMQRGVYSGGRANLYVQLRSANPLNDVSNAHGIDLGCDGTFDVVRYNGEINPGKTAHVERLLNMAVDKMAVFRIQPLSRPSEQENEE